MAPGGDETTAHVVEDPAHEGLADGGTPVVTHIRVLAQIAVTPNALIIVGEELLIHRRLYGRASITSKT